MTVFSLSATEMAPLWRWWYRGHCSATSDWSGTPLRPHRCLIYREWSGGRRLREYIDTPSWSLWLCYGCRRTLGGRDHLTVLQWPPTTLPMNLWKGLVRADVYRNSLEVDVYKNSLDYIFTHYYWINLWIQLTYSVFCPWRRPLIDMMLSAAGNLHH